MTDQPQKNWWGRNWKWFVPVGCLGTLAMIGVFIALIVTLVFGMLKSSDAYKMAMENVQNNAVVQATLGTPIEAGMFVGGNISVNGASGQADLSIPISGPKGSATLYVVAEKKAGAWSFATLVVELQDSGERLDLLQ